MGLSRSLSTSAPSGGITLGPAESLLITRAADYLVAGPAMAHELVAHVCQLPAAPGRVAEHMAAALFAGDARFVREPDGRWNLRSAAAQAPSAPSHAALDGVVAAAGGALAGLSYCVVDVETTGTSPDRGDRITEIAAVRVHDGVVSTVFDSLINPERSIPPYITALTRISWDMVKDAPRFGDVCDQLLGVLEGSVFVAHNAAFDWRFVAAEVHRATGRRIDGRRLCTVRLARRLLPQLRRRSLDAVTYHYGIDIAARHRAGGDAEATAHVLVRLLAEAHARGCADWDALERLLGPSSRRRTPRRPPAMPRPVDKDTTA